jgi:hypothetical protein
MLPSLASDWSNPSGSTSVPEPRCRSPSQTPPPTDRLTTSSAQIFASLVLDLFCAIVADFHTRVEHLFSKPRYSVLMSPHQSRCSTAKGMRQRIERHAKQSIGKRASERVKQPTCQNEIRPSRQVFEKVGAGEGNRTLVFSLEGLRRLKPYNACLDKTTLTCPIDPKPISVAVQTHHWEAASRSLLHHLRSKLRVLAAPRQMACRTLESSCEWGLVRQAPDLRVSFNSVSAIGESVTDIAHSYGADKSMISRMR